MSSRTQRPVLTAKQYELQGLLFFLFSIIEKHSTY